MSLEAGARLGPYELSAPLGAGGMGEVYKARDTRLGRTVAIKVLPSDLAASVELKQRFEREAKAISSLQHPNICTLHDIGSQDGVDFLVMEYLEGRTLAERLAEGALPLNQALKVGVEIADALDKAHRQGIIHRDLKPGNIMLTRSGAKLMDFGLAKPAVALAAGATGAATPATPTMSVAFLTAAVSPVTQKGTIVGTCQYMAPETLQGAQADARSDIFSFGCVLYEMVTGRPAFGGKSPLSVLTAILEKEPEPIAAIQPFAPPALHHLVRACLAKDPDRRTGCAHDLKLELEWLASEPQLPVKSDEAQRHWRERAIWLATVLLCIAGLLYLLVRRPVARVIRSSMLAPKNSVLDAPSSPGSFAVAPDGSAVVFSAVTDGVGRLYLRRLNDPEATVLSGTEDGRYPFWSPDSTSIGFFTNGELRRIDLRGGPPVTLCPSSNGRGGAWGTDGNIYFVPSTSADVMRVPVSGGTPATAVQVDRPRHDNYRWPVLLPDEKHLIFFAGSHSDTTNDRAEIIWASINGREEHVLLRSTSNAAYTAGYLLFTRGGHLWLRSWMRVPEN